MVCFKVKNFETIKFLWYLSSPIKRNATENTLLSMDGVSYTSLISIANYNSWSWIKMSCLGPEDSFLLNHIGNSKSKGWFSQWKSGDSWWWWWCFYYCQCLWNPTHSYIYTPMKHMSWYAGCKRHPYVRNNIVITTMFCNKTPLPPIRKVDSAAICPLCFPELSYFLVNVPSVLTLNSPKKAPFINLIIAPSPRHETPSPSVKACWHPVKSVMSWAY